MKKSIINLVIILLMTNCSGQIEKVCKEPKEVNAYRIKNLPGSEIIEEKHLIKDWKSFTETDITCPTMLDYDFTNDGYKDFICMLKDKEGMHYLIAFNNYETANISYQIIEGVADYGEHGIGNIIYQDSNDVGKFYSYKMESSIALIFWRNGKYEVDYGED
jgi:hypothetical protein